MRKYLLKIVNAQISVSSWILAAIGFATAAVVFVQVLSPTTPNLDQFLVALPLINAKVWAGGLVIASMVLLIGMAKTWVKFIRYGAMASIVLWISGATAFIILGQTTTIILLLGPLMLFFIYIFLASLLRDELQL